MSYKTLSAAEALAKARGSTLGILHCKASGLKRMHLLSSDNRSEFLACPQLVRFDYVMGEGGFEPTLLVKGSTLLLKYVVAGAQLQLLIARVADHLLYGLKVHDDPEKPAVLWSIMERVEELTALNALSKGQDCQIFLFNELAVNVAWAASAIKLSQRKLALLTRGLSCGSADYPLLKGAAKRALDRLIAGEDDESIIVDIQRVANWHKINNLFLTNSAVRSAIDLFDNDEGNQQEQLAIWLTDNLHPSGACHSPQIPSGPRKRELTDVLLTYDNGTFLIESKTVALQSRANKPNRSRLVRDTSQRVANAVSQLQGGIRKIKSGVEVTSRSGEVINLERTKPIHAIVLISDLDLLIEDEGYGLDFMRDFMEETGGFLHLLDVAELLRMVQAAEVIAAQGKQTTPMMAFDFYLMERAKRSLEAGTLRFSMLLRVV